MACVHFVTSFLFISIHSFGFAHLKNDSVCQDGDFLLQQRLPGHKDLAVVHPLRPAAAKTDVSSSLRARSREENETLGVKAVPLLPGRRLLGSSPSLMVLAVRRQSLSQGSVQDVFELILHLLQDAALQLLQGNAPGEPCVNLTISTSYYNYYCYYTSITVFSGFLSSAVLKSPRE